MLTIHQGRWKLQQQLIYAEKQQTLIVTISLIVPLTISSSIAVLSSSLSLAATKAFKVFLNLIYLTGFVLQHKGIKISSVPLFVINLLSWLSLS